MQHLHGAVAVAVLGALGLAGDHDAGGQVREADRGVGLVHVLAAGAAGAVGVHAQVLLVDLDLDVVVDFGHDVQRGERRVPPLVGVERADAHQPVHAALGLQVAVGVRAGHEERDALDAGLLAGQVVEDAHLEPVLLAVAAVHAEQHLGPVAGLGAARARVQAQVGVVRVELPAQQGAHLEVRLLGSRPA